MKTKVVQHVPRINISMSQTQSQSHWFPALDMLTFFIYQPSFIFSDLLFLVALTSSIFIVSEVKKLGEKMLLRKNKRLYRSDSTKTLMDTV